MCNSIVNHIVYSGQTYPEIRREFNAAGQLRITTHAVKVFLYENGLISQDELISENTEKSVIVMGLYKAFRAGILSLNATKQAGVSNLTPVRVSTGLKGKLDDVPAISTISLANDFCLARMKMTGIVCHDCYVPASLRIDGILAYTQNMFVLTADLLPAEWIPVITLDPEKFPIIRLESFGDLACTIQARNYLTIARKNSVYSFGAWTKNPAVFAAAVDTDGKPENISAVLSMSRVNVMDPAAYIARWESYFDHVFIVNDDDDVTAEMLQDENTYQCRCGFHSCWNCQRCYHRDGKLTRAVEKLRKQSKH